MCRPLGRFAAIEVAPVEEVVALKEFPSTVRVRVEMSRAWSSEYCTVASTVDEP